MVAYCGASMVRESLMFTFRVLIVRFQLLTRCFNFSRRSDVVCLERTDKIQYMTKHIHSPLFHTLPHRIRGLKPRTGSWVFSGRCSRH